MIDFLPAILKQTCMFNDSETKNCTVNPWEYDPGSEKWFETPYFPHYYKIIRKFADNSSKFNSSKFEDKIRYELELPGVKSTDLSVTVHDQHIVVKGKKKNVEFEHVLCPENVYELDAASVLLENGVLYVDVPIKESAKPKQPRQLEIKTS